MTDDETAKAGDKLGVNLGSNKTDRSELPRGQFGTCGFCGIGDGYLLETGDETSQILHAAVRTGDTPDEWKYTPHPGAYDEFRQSIVWCGQCVGGLKHKYQRYDDTNLRALFISSKVRLELDGMRWTHWEVDRGEEKDALNKHHPRDDQAVHMEKLRIERDLRDIQQEIFRRYGHDLTQGPDPWRP